MIEPFWGEIAVYAPFDQSFKQPTCIHALAQLERQLPLLSDMDIAALRVAFATATTALPSDDDDPMTVALYPLCDSNQIVKERQNGVVGASVFGNIIIQMNPLADDWQAWVPYVFAHEYHHNLWGHYWYVVRDGKDLAGTFLEYLITEGQADLFAMHMHPNLKPQWNQSLTADDEQALWARYKPILQSTDPAFHAAYMFGDSKQNLPWCAGYRFGANIVADFLRKQPMPFAQLLQIPANHIFENSSYF
ncbi:MAG: DUF2268 domain-containing protein [Defluviitaleaceae bacterium]|nr:DUF2268 domain-containing protein [Defluviitaleaceae bacterium]